MSQNQRIQGIIFDWAGTMIDHGSRAPAAVFTEIFAREGIQISSAQAREPMGMAKREHIAAIASMPEVASQFEARLGRAAGDADIDRMYQQFLPLQKSTLADHCDLIDGARETFEWCQQRGIHVGSSTGYTRELMEVVKPLAAQAGYQPEIVLCAEDAPQGRPAPWLIYQCAQQWNVYPMDRIVKVDDTLVGIEAGRNAGCWTIGISRTGNLMGLSVPEWNDLDESEKQVRLDAATDKFQQAGADFVVPSVAQVPDVIGQIEDQAGGPGSFGGG